MVQNVDAHEPGQEIVELHAIGSRHRNSIISCPHV
jgi:hypothetical protein